MKLEGIHHVTCVTADAPSNADFYVRVLGLRIVKKTINQVDQTTYHIFYGDERASYGNNISFFEYRGRPDGRIGAGNAHTIVWRVGSDEALDFWERRLADEGVTSERGEGTLRFTDHEGLPHELAVVDVPDEPLTGESPDMPAEHALQGFDGVPRVLARRRRDGALPARPARLRAAARRALGGARDQARRLVRARSRPRGEGQVRRRDHPARRLGLPARGHRGVAEDRRASTARTRPA